MKVEILEVLDKVTALLSNETALSVVDTDSEVQEKLVNTANKAFEVLEKRPHAPKSTPRSPICFRALD